MNRLTKKIAAVALAVLVLGAVSVQAREKQPKKKKNVDLSANPLAGVNSKQPDKELFDKAMVAMKKGRYDVARLDLQTMLNTYPDSEYRMRAKLAVGDSWFKEGGAAALTQAEAEYKDFITFFPNAPEAAEAQMKVADIYYQQMEKPDRDYTNAQRAEQEYRAMINQFPDSTLVPRAKQKLRDVQEVLAERETQIGLFYDSRDNMARPLPACRRWSIPIRFIPRATRRCWASAMPMLGEARNVQIPPSSPRRDQGAVARGLPGPGRRGLRQSDYPLSHGPPRGGCPRPAGGHEPPRPRAHRGCGAESDAEERSRQPLHFTDRTLGIIKHGPAVVEAVHVGEPSLDDPKRTLAPEITKQNVALFSRRHQRRQTGRQTPGRHRARRPPMSLRAAISPTRLPCSCNRRKAAPA